MKKNMLLIGLAVLSVVVIGQNIMLQRNISAFMPSATNPAMMQNVAYHGQHQRGWGLHF